MGEVFPRPHKLLLKLTQCSGHFFLANKMARIIWSMMSWRSVSALAGRGLNRATAEGLSASKRWLSVETTQSAYNTKRRPS
jgi:hypothetical protein